MSVCPIFVLSLPRAGSTLTQRVLGAHPDIATSAEPWILLPYLYSLRRRGAMAEYGHSTMVDAVESFANDALPGGMTDYTDEMRYFALRLYERAAEGKPFFLDKTPRYHFIVDDLIDMFPNAKYIFLWRNPLAVIASLISTMGKGKWNLQYYSVDLFHGFDRLERAQKTLGRRAMSVRYEDLVANSSNEVKRLCDYLEVPLWPSIVEDFSQVDVRGVVGDPGSHEYQKITSAPLVKWRAVLSNPIRRAWADGYLTWIGESRLAAIGYDLDELRGALDSVPMTTDGMVGDLGRILYGKGRLIRHSEVFAQKTPRVLLAGRPARVFDRKRKRLRS